MNLACVSQSSRHCSRPPSPCQRRASSLTGSPAIAVILRGAGVAPFPDPLAGRPRRPYSSVTPMTIDADVLRFWYETEVLALPRVPAPSGRELPAAPGDEPGHAALAPGQAPPWPVAPFVDERETRWVAHHYVYLGLFRHEDAIAELLRALAAGRDDPDRLEVQLPAERERFAPGGLPGRVRRRPQRRPRQPDVRPGQLSLGSRPAPRGAAPARLPGGERGGRRGVRPGAGGRSRPIPTTRSRRRSRR